MSKKLISAVAAASLGVAALSTAPAHAEITATAGFVSDYYFRGANLGDGGANASFDWANDSGFSAGVWAIDDGTGGNDGLEYDIYGGYGAETDSFSYSIGYARYEYTYTTDFEHEVNLGLGVGNFGLALDIGQDEDDGVDAVDYTHYGVSYAATDVFGLALGQVDPDTDTDDDEWTYVEVSAGGTVSELDVSMTLGTVSGDAYPNTSGYMVLSASKTFDM